MVAPVSRLLNGSTDWMLLPMAFGFGSNVQSFTLGLWISSADVTGVNKALISADGASSSSSLGLYWSNTTLTVRYYWRPPGSPGAAGTLDTKSVAYATAAGTPTFIAITGTGDIPAPASTMTFRFYAGTTPTNIVQVGADQVAAGSIKSNNRHFAVGCTTTGNSGSQSATGNFFGGNVQRIGYFDDQALTLAELQHFALTSAPQTVNALAQFGYPNGMVFEIWGDNPEGDHSLNFGTTDSITGTTVVTPIAPDSGWSYNQTLGNGRQSGPLYRLSNGDILGVLRLTISGSTPAEIWKSVDDGVTWTLKDTLVPMGSIDMFVEPSPGVVVSAGFRSPGPAQIWKSLDYGDSWTFASELGATTVINTLLDLGGGTILAATNTLGVGKIYRSVDSGSTWNFLTNVVATTGVTALIDLGGGVLLAGGEANDIYRSTDSGANWSALATLSPGITGGVVMRYMGSGVVLAGTGFGDLFYSSDSGASWVRTLNTGDFFLNFFNSIPSGAFLVIGACTFALPRKFGHVYKSGDGGQTWTELVVNTRGVSEHIGSMALTDTILTASDFGFLSTDQGIYELSLDVFSDCGVTPPTELEASCPDSLTIQLGVPFSAFVPVSGGTPPYTFELVGGALPDGLTLDTATGEISGIPTEDGTFFFTILITDADGNTVEITCGIELPCPPFRIFWQDSNVRAHSWKDSGEQAYHTIRAFGGRHQIDGAKI